jgi:uncharacterized damage-inducible protein DinB
MTKDMTAQDRLGLTDYFEETWKAREKLLDAAETLTPDEWRREFDFSWRSMQKLFAHIIEVERSWMLDDIRGEKYPYPNADEVPGLYPTPAQARLRGREVAAITRAVLAEYDLPGTRMETREVGGADGSRINLTIEQILIHVFTHELRHQGQLQVVLRLLGKKPPNADWF